MAKRSLIVEGQKDALSILVLFVRSLGYETVKARTGADSVEKAFRESQSNRIGYEPSRHDRYRCTQG